MVKAARVLLVVLCLAHPFAEGVSVAALHGRARPTATRRAAVKRPAPRRPVPPLRSARPRRGRPAMRTAGRAAVPPARTAPPRGHRLRRFTRWTGRVLGLRGAVRFVERVFAFLRPGKRVGDLGASGLTWAGTRSIGAVQPALAAVSGVAGVTLAAASAFELARARSHVERADAAHGIAWGLQSIGGLGSMWWHAPGWVEPLAFGLGIGGGVIQSAVGLYRLRTGIATRDRRSIVLGLLDTGAGASWLASTVTGNPVALTAFFGLTGARLLYTNGPRMKAFASRAARRVARAFE